MIDPKTRDATLKICGLPNIDELRKAAVVRAMIEVVSRPEPGLVAPRLAAYIRSRKPSELSPKVSSVLLDGIIFQIELECNQKAILTDLAKAGKNPLDARTTFESKVVQAKWEMMDSLASGEVEA
jgi:hypothetical protein